MHDSSHFHFLLNMERIHYQNVLWDCTYLDTLLCRSAGWTLNAHVGGAHTHVWIAITSGRTVRVIEVGLTCFMIVCSRLHCEDPCSSSSSLCLASLVVRPVPWSGFCIRKKPKKVGGRSRKCLDTPTHIHTHTPSHTQQHSTHIHTNTKSWMVTPTCTRDWPWGLCTLGHSPTL